jgi:HK97 gp10 family phage protein
MADDFEIIIAEWESRMDAKFDAIEAAADKAFLKAALYCEGEAKKNVAAAVYATPSSDYYNRTGLLQASIHSGLDETTPHTAIIYSDAPYAKYVEFGTGPLGAKSEVEFRPFSGGYRNTPWFYEDANGDGHWTNGMRARPFMYPAVMHNKEQITTIITKYLKEAAKLDG